jgi:glucosamine 6-phosphate synthetase-like amidotransferase/phosphosugar isomerase protein
MTGWTFLYSLWQGVPRDVLPVKIYWRNIMGNSGGLMYDYILETKDTARSIIKNRAEILESAVDCFVNSGAEQVYIIGSGTSYHAGLAVRRFMENTLKIPVHVSYPLVFKDTESIFNKKTVVIGGSHGGRSSSTIEGLDKARAEGLVTIASTAVHGSEIVSHGDCVIYCEIGEENTGPKTKGYFCAVVTYVLFALASALRRGLITKDEEESCVERLQKSTDNIPLIAEKADGWFRNQESELIGARRIIIIGYENNIATYMEGALKILEAVRYGVYGYELEEFKHGIYHSVWDDSFMFYIGSQGKYYPGLISLKRYFEERTAHNFLFTADRSQESQKNFVFPFNDDRDFSCLEYIVPLQVTACRLSASLGIDADISSDPDFHRKMGSYRY